MESVLNTFYLVNSRVLTYQCTSPILHLYPLLQFSALACPSYDPSDRMADQPFTFLFFCCLAYSALTQFLQEKSAQLADTPQFAWPRLLSPTNWPAQHNQTSPEWESWHTFLMCKKLSHFPIQKPFFCTILPVPDYLSPPSGLAGPQLCAHRMLTPTHFRKVKFSTISQLTTHVPLSNHMQKPQGDCVPLSLAHNSPPARLESLMTDPYHKNYSASRYQLFQHAMS